MTSETVSATHVSELKNKIEQRQAKVAIIGLGYVGLPLALLYSESGFPVTGFDIDKRKVSTLEAGGSYIFRITAPEESYLINMLLVRTNKALESTTVVNPAVAWAVK